jgi:acetyl esterase/lipase
MTGVTSSILSAEAKTAPAHRFPAATEDLMKVYKWALKDLAR